MAPNEGELPALEQHAAISRREAPAALRAIGDHLADGELSGKRLALRFEVDAGGEAFELMAAGKRPPELGDHRGKITAWLHRRENLRVARCRIGAGRYLRILSLGLRGLRKLRLA